MTRWEMESQAILVLPSAGRFTGDSDGAGSDAFDARITKKEHTLQNRVQRLARVEVANKHNEGQGQESIRFVKLVLVNIEENRRKIVPD